MEISALFTYRYFLALLSALCTLWNIQPLVHVVKYYLQRSLNWLIDLLSFSTDRNENKLAQWSKNKKTVVLCFISKHSGNIFSPPFSSFLQCNQTSNQINLIDKRTHKYCASLKSGLFGYRTQSQHVLEVFAYLHSWVQVRIAAFACPGMHGGCSSSHVVLHKEG